jgi:pimeloyl-ACP methyl ester carboxylesterase
MIIYQWYGVGSFPELDTSPQIGQQVLEGSFWLKVNKPLNRRTLVRYILPLDPDSGRPSSSASRIVFYAPFNGDAKRIRKELPRWLRRFATEGGCTVFSLTIEADKEPKHLKDREFYYIYPESGWAELVFAIEEHLRKQFGLSKQKLLVVGESSGGSMAQMMALRYPERIASAAWHGGSRYDHFEAPLSVRILALNSWCDYALQPTIEMVRQTRIIGQQIDFFALPPVYYDNGRLEAHAPAQLSYDLIYEFTLHPDVYLEHTKYLPSVDFVKNEYYEYPVNPSKKHIAILLLWNCRPNVEDDLRLRNTIGALVKQGFAPAFQRVDYMSNQEIIESLGKWSATHKEAIILAPDSLALPENYQTIRYQKSCTWSDIVRLISSTKAK